MEKLELYSIALGDDLLVARRTKHSGWWSRSRFDYGSAYTAEKPKAEKRLKEVQKMQPDARLYQLTAEELKRVQDLANEEEARRIRRQGYGKVDLYTSKRGELVVLFKKKNSTAVERAFFQLLEKAGYQPNTNTVGRPGFWIRLSLETK